MTPDSIGLIVGAVLTVLVLTYLIGDSPLFRFAVYVLIGAGAAYAAVVVLFDVLWQNTNDAVAQAALGNRGPLIIMAVALVLGVMVWFKGSPRLAWIGNIPMGYLIGVGAATVLGGAVIGTLGPQIVAAGAPVISAFSSYAMEKKLSRHPEKFGTGVIEGVAGPEAANNSATGGAFIPLFTLGIPANSVIAVLLGAFMIHGIQPGPSLIAKYPDFFWGTIMSMYLGNVMLLILNLPLIGLWVQVLKIP